VRALLLLPLLVLPRAQEAELPFHDVVRVVDGDTLWIERNGELEKLRLVSVDTEEKILGLPAISATKPETVFGEETAQWARAFFAELAEPGRPPRVALRFPDGKEQRDAYGRLLCHVLLPDGRDFNLLLVAEGRSPYFNKYGNSPLCHEAFVRAQEEARRLQLGIWNPATNRPRNTVLDGVEDARRHYEWLLPWWQARADALDAFRAARAAGAFLIDAEAPVELARALVDCEAHPENDVEVFGSIDRFFDEEDGSLTVLFRTGDRQRAFRAELPASRDAALETMLRTSTDEMRQNYLIVRGRVFRGERGYRMHAGSSAAWRLAGPEPGSPPELPANEGR